MQLFPASKTKNGADFRLAVDAIEDLYLHDDLTHVVIAAGDSDFVPLAQRVRRLGRAVLGVGVAGSISKTLASACDVYVDYDELLDDRQALERVSASESPAADPPAPRPTERPATNRPTRQGQVEGRRPGATARPFRCSSRQCAAWPPRTPTPSGIHSTP